MSSTKTYICLDIGGTYIKHGLLTETGEILIKGKIPTRAKEGGQAVFEQAVGLVEGYLEKKKTSAISEKETDFLRVDREEPFPVSLDERPDTEKHSESDFIRQTQVETDLSEADEIAVEMQDHTGKISGIAISTAGMVDPATGTILHASDAIPGYAGISYKAYMEEHFHLPCAVENDVNCAGLAESISGAGKGSRINLCLTVGTGIGGCLVVDGKVFHGASNSACEVGYMHLAPGAFQDEAATSALVRRVTERKKAEVWDGFRIFEAAKAGDPICQEELDRLADLLGMGIANICFVINPVANHPRRRNHGAGSLHEAPDRGCPGKTIWFPQIWKHTTVCMAAYQNNRRYAGSAVSSAGRAIPGKFYKFV